MMCLCVYGCLRGNLSLRMPKCASPTTSQCQRERLFALLLVFSLPPLCPFLLTHHIDSRPSPLLVSTLTFRFFHTVMGTMWYLWESRLERRIQQLLVQSRREENQKKEFKGNLDVTLGGRMYLSMPPLRCPKPEVPVLTANYNKLGSFKSSRCPDLHPKPITPRIAGAGTQATVVFKAP